MNLFPRTHSSAAVPAGQKREAVLCGCEIVDAVKDGAPAIFPAVRRYGPKMENFNA